MPSASQLFQMTVIRFLLVFMLVSLFLSFMQHDATPRYSTRHTTPAPHVPSTAAPPIVHLHLTPMLSSGPGGTDVGAADRAARDGSTHHHRKPSRRGIDEVAASLAFLNESQWRTILRNVGRVYARNEHDEGSECQEELQK